MIFRIKQFRTPIVSRLTKGERAGQRMTLGCIWIKDMLPG